MNSLEKASNLNEVTIFNAVTDEAVNGLMQESLSLSFNPNYFNVKDISDTVGGIIQKIDDLQIIPTNLISTAQIYKDGDYLDLGIKLRITDSTGNGTPMKAATLLGQWGSPWDHKLRSWDTTQIYVEDKINNNSKKSRLTGNAPHAIRNGKEAGSPRRKANVNGANVDKWGAVNWSDKLSNAVTHVTDGDSGEAFTELLGLITDVKLSVAIGDWFFARGNMILKSVTQTFSSEQGPAGPLYVDLDINLQSITVLTKRNVLDLYPLVQKSNEDDTISRSYAQLSLLESRFSKIGPVSDAETPSDINSVKQQARKDKSKKLSDAVTPILKFLPNGGT